MFDVQASSAQTGGLPPLSTATAGAAPLVSSSIKLGRNPDINIKLTYGERTGEGFSHSPQPLGKHRAPGDLEATLVGSRLHDAKERENAEPACAPSRLPHINPKMKFKRVPGLAKSCKQSSAVKLPSGNKTLENVDSHVSHGKVKCQKEGAVRAVTSLPCATAVTKGEQRVGPIPLGPSGESRNDCEDLCERFCSFIGQLEVDQSSSGGITPRNDAQGQEEFVCLGKSLSIRTLSHSSSIEGTPKLAGADASPNLVPRKARGGRPSLLRGPADSKPALPGASLVRRPSLKELKMERKASIMSLKFREAEGKELGVPDDMPVESTVMQRMLMRGSQRRRTKKDAPSIFSVELPTFDKETGKVGDGCSFPSSLSVAEAIDSVLQLERGEQKLKTTSVGVTKFLKEFPESHEIIHLYFWYIVSHARRVSSERLLIDRHLNLEQVFRTTFSRRVSELPPLSSLERIITSWLSNIELRKSVHRGGVEGAEPPVTGDCEARDSLEDPKKTQGGLHSVPRLVPGSVSGTGGASDWYGNPFSLPSLDSVLLADGCEKEEERRMPLGCTQVPSIQDLKMMACRLANAVDTFTVAHVEVCELRELGERCFHRLAMLFGEAFGRLQADKDEVFSAYMILVPHVVYYTLVYCFPNDYLAGILNSMVRVSIYRVFYFWCSGLVATYVRTTAWPTPNQRRVFTQGHESSGRPELDGELKTPRQNNESRELTPRLSENFPPSSAEELASSDYLPSTGQVDPYGYPNFITDDSFDDIDVDVANGHHRIVLEFKKYVKHVNFLFQKLEQRTTNTHPLLTETPKGEQSDSCNGKKNVRGVCAGKVGGDACGANKGVKPCSSSTSEARNDGGPMKDAARRKKKQKTANPRPSIGWDGRSSPGLGDDDRKKETHANEAAEAYPNYSNNASRDCVICDFPLASSPRQVREYINSHSNESTFEVPLPPLSGPAVEPPPFSFVGNKDANTCVLPAVITTGIKTARDRTVKVPLPSSSPLFLHYARHRLHPSVVSSLEGASVRNQRTQAQHIVHGMSVKQGNKDLSPLYRNSQSFSPMNVAQVPHAFSTAHSNSITVGGSRTVKGFVEMHRKAVNMTLIPPSDTHPRPLQFAGLTKEIRKRQVQFEQQLLSLQEREQQQRQEYNKSTQRGINLTHHLLSGIDNDPSSSEANKMILRGQKKKDVKQQKVLKSE